ncbi:HAMP domain-containing sensor histidine kinase [Acaryochloris sp. IP29b_bin.137]|uniref:sensor histidine kinase n=1 Tax=Acaryochloris sp. IP29b_bin.137 TaxID=2969217 RepID=UPI002605B2E4|nr:HAMP domain-containing sensor histidine kinase [Acaryochloris sp. IP29b_bin.137]
MFWKVRLQLLGSYLMVLAGIMVVFAIAIRTTFSYTLHHQIGQRLQNLVKAGSLELEIEDGRLELDQEDLVRDLQSLQWYDPTGQLVGTQGQPTSNRPLNPQQLVRLQTYANLKSMTVPAQDPNTGQLIGFVRANESLEAVNQTLQQLDWGLGGGAILAIFLSGIGGTWLTARAMHPIEQNMRQLQQFTADASHELRSPLTAIKTNATVAQKYPQGMRPTDAEKFQAILSAANQMTALTESLLQLARLDQSSEQHQDPINLLHTLEELSQHYQHQAQSKGITLTTQFADPTWVLGHEDQLRQVFANLLENALQYTPAGGAVEIKSTRVGPSILIQVQDTGMGIRAEHQEKIFDRFWQADTSRSYQADGCGLGLAIARRIVQLHQGNIAVESDWTQGSCFSIKLPLYDSSP